MIQLIDVHKEYKSKSGRIRALNGVSLTVEKGQRLGVIGRNGAGKSTLIRIVGGVELPTQGSVVRKMTVSWPLGFRGALQQHLSGYDNIRFLCRIYDLPFDRITAFVEDFSELGQRLRDPINTYSSGMRAKLSFGLSLAFEFDCYLVDEVIAVGDHRFRAKCHAELFERRADRALLMVSHQSNIIEQYCQMGILLEEGRCLETFAVDEAQTWRKHLNKH
jgi:capsular polysaccharide transport system ATP-binding protein